MISVEKPHDYKFEKYQKIGAYHWTEISNNWLWHHSFTAERYRRALALLGTLSGKRILDYGCGDGALLGMISKQVGASGEAHGFDPNSKAVELAEALLVKHRLAANVCSASSDLPDDYYDGVVCTEVIEHVYDPLHLLNEIHRVLKPGATVVITTPVRLTERPGDPNHIQEWFPSEFADLVSQ